MQANVLKYPLRHLSVRVPWHDSGWSGLVCASPHLNGSCAKLKGIAAAKSDDQERLIAGRSLSEMPNEQWPCCVAERGAFMAPFEMDHIKRHALAEKNPKFYGHFQPTVQRYPQYSFGAVPFRWMMVENIEEYRDTYDLDIDPSREPDLGYKTNWIHEVSNQRTLLDTFASHLRKDDSLCLIYAKHVPFVEGTGRVLMGAGRVSHVGQLQEYKRVGPGMAGMVWERPIQHSIRPKGTDGFLMPYHELLTLAEKDPSLDIDRYVAKAPDERWDEFSYASELVTHDGAIGALLALESSLERIETELGLPCTWQKKWIHDELVRLWRVRGPFPGLGAVLTAFGFSRGVFVAHALQQKAGENENPWPLVDLIFKTPDSFLPKALQRDIKELAPVWKGISPERKAYIKLLSRFELTKNQADLLYDDGSRDVAGFEATDAEILKNPYRLYEVSRHHPQCLHLLSVDRGLFPEDSVRAKHPLPSPSALESAVDERRLCAFAVSVLEDAAANGDTLLSKSRVVEAVLGQPVRPPCPVTGDIIAARLPDMASEIAPAEVDGQTALQLNRYKSIRERVQKEVLGRIGISSKRHTIKADWNDLLATKFGPDTNDEVEETLARQEKAAALKELSESRFSVLVGPAGAGKTTVLGILCAQPQILGAGVLLLAPTGKARVRMQELVTGSGTKAMTIAQFLYQNNRYDVASSRYVTSDSPKAHGFATVIVDEASMLTEDMVGALFDALQGVQRYIFVGDPAQLPPIGAGRPLVDIVAKLRPADNETRFPRVAPGYAELTIERRQVGSDRPDLRFARWFSNVPPAAGDDDMFVACDNVKPVIRFVEWDQPDDFQSKLIELLIEELQLEGPDDVRGFNEKLGASSNGDYDYFNATRNTLAGAVAKIEDWQILSPLRGMPFGVGDINRKIHEQFRSNFIELASRQWHPIPAPFGAERIVYGDKVMNLMNRRRKGYPKDGSLDYLANGEIGIAVGQWLKGKTPTILNVEFSSQRGFTYGFFSSDFSEEGSAALELAYALTVHKAQGSQFGLVILVLPQGHPILSRELVYTALTRHQDRVVVMHQGPRVLLKELAAPQRSATARRMTNLLQVCKMEEFPQAKGSIFLQAGLIHRTSTGLAVRSKSEIVIADALTNAGISFVYEKPLTLGGSTRYPDFTIEDEISGRLIYREHLGMLEREDYRKSWERKLVWYKSHGILPATEGEGSNGILVTTTESSTKGFDASSVRTVIKDYIQG